MKFSLRLLQAAVLLTVFFGLAATQARTQDPHHPDQETVFALDASRPEQHQGTMNQNMTKMMGEMKAADAKLDALVRAMNAAKGAEKTDAIAAVVTALVEERRSMHSSMAAMMTMMNTMGAPDSMHRDNPKP